MLGSKQFQKFLAIGLVLVAMALLVGVTQAEKEAISVISVTQRMMIQDQNDEIDTCYHDQRDISANGRYFVTKCRNPKVVNGEVYRYDSNIYLYDTHTNESKLISRGVDNTLGDRTSTQASISSNGRYIVFISSAKNLVEENIAGGGVHIYVHDMQTDLTERIPLKESPKAFNNTYDPKISDDGKYVFFTAYYVDSIYAPARFPGDLYIFNRETSIVSLLLNSVDGGVLYYDISSDARYVAFSSSDSKLIANDVNDKPDIFLFDRELNVIELISIAEDGTQANDSSYAPLISNDGQIITYFSTANNLVSTDTNWLSDLFVFNRETNSTQLLYTSDGEQLITTPESYDLSASGRFISFVSEQAIDDTDSNDLSDVYLHDRETGTYSLISIGYLDEPSDGKSYGSLVSENGETVVFISLASNLVEADNNNGFDYFVSFRDTTTSPEPSPSSTPEPTPTAEQVVVFIPGIAGSRLVDNVPALPPDIIWPSFAFDSKDKLRLKPGLRDDNIVTDDVIRQFLGRSVYKSFLDRLSENNGYVEYETRGDPDRRRQNGCDTSQTNANLFVFPWDWRYGAVDAVNNEGMRDPDLSLSPNNVELLEEYILCVLQIHSDAEITLVTHSMGWFIGRTYVLENITSHNITRHIAIAPPRLGAPEAIEMMLTGNWNWLLLGKDETRTLLEHFPGAHQLLPSELYWNFAGSPFSLNNPLTKRGDIEFSEFQQVLQGYYTSPAEGVLYRSSVPFVKNMQKGYQDPAFADLRGDISEVKYHVVYGIQDTDETTGKISEKPIWRYDNTLELDNFDIDPTRGDGTVPDVSASAMTNTLNLNGNATLHELKGDEMEHQTMMNEPRLQDCVLALLQGETCISDVSSATANQSASARYIKLWGVDNVSVTDGISTTENLMTTTLTLGIFTDISTKYLGDNSIMFIITGDKQYRVNFTGQGEYFESESQYGTGGNNLRTIRFSPEPAAGQHLSLVTTQATIAEMEIDTDGDGQVDTSIEPAADLERELANDTTKPVVTASYDAATGLLVTATDAESGVASISYTVDDTHFESYTAAVVFTDQSITSVSVIAQDKAGNFSDPVTIPVTVIASNTIYLPLITR